LVASYSDRIEKKKSTPCQPVSLDAHRSAVFDSNRKRFGKVLRENAKGLGQKNLEAGGSLAETKV
jgi:hypothetical protein